MRKKMNIKRNWMEHLRGDTSASKWYTVFNWGMYYSNTLHVKIVTIIPMPSSDRISFCPYTSSALMHVWLKVFPWIRSQRMFLAPTAHLVHPQKHRSQIYQCTSRNSELQRDRVHVGFDWHSTDSHIISRWAGFDTCPLYILLPV